MVDQDLTAAALAPAAASGSALASWMQSDGPHIVCQMGNQHILQIWYTTAAGVWNYQDLTGILGAAAPEAGTPLSTFVGPDGDHVYFVDTNHHLDQLWWTGIEWVWQDLSSGVAAQNLPNATTGLTNFSLDGIVPQIAFIDPAGDLEQRWWQNSGLVQEDLTQLISLPFTISGQVTSLGAGLSGVEMTLSGDQSGTAITDANGDYSFTVLYGGIYTVAASLSGYNFSPGPQTFNYVGANQTADFAGTIPGGPGTQPNAAREFIRLNGQVVAVETGH